MLTEILALKVLLHNVLPCFILFYTEEKWIEMNTYITITNTSKL